MVKAKNRPTQTPRHAVKYKKEIRRCFAIWVLTWIKRSFIFLTKAKAPMHTGRLAATVLHHGRLAGSYKKRLRGGFIQIRNIYGG